MLPERAWRRGGLAALASFDTTLLAAALLLVAAAAALMGVQSDTWWQLRTGQLIVSTGHIPTTDVFSSTVPGAYWPNHEWLALVIFYGLYALGGLPVLFFGCTALVLLPWAGLARLAEGPGRVRAAVLLIAMASQSVIWSVRPHLFSLALVVVALLLLPQRRLHWLYPPLFLLWANLHAGVAFGGVILLVATLAALAEDGAAHRLGRGRQAGNSVRWVIITFCSGIATLLNPLGIGLWRYVIDSFGDSTRAYLSEWQPPSLSWPASYPFFVLVALTGVAALAARRSWRGQRDWTLLGLAILFGWLGFRSMRHTAFFTIVAVPLLSRPFCAWPPLAARGGARLLANVGLIVVLAAGSALVVSQAWAATQTAPLSDAIVAGVRQCPGPLYNTYDTGGPLIWQVPERPVFVDNRQDPYPPDLLFRAALAEQQGTYRELFTAYHVRCALVPTTTALYAALRRDRWAELARDDKLAVLQAGAAP